MDLSVASTRWGLRTELGWSMSGSLSVMASETFLFALLSMPVAAVRMVVSGWHRNRRGRGELEWRIVDRHFKSGQRAFKYKSVQFCSIRTNHFPGIVMNNLFKLVTTNCPIDIFSMDTGFRPQPQSSSPEIQSPTNLFRVCSESLSLQIPFLCFESFLKILLKILCINPGTDSHRMPWGLLHASTPRGIGQHGHWYVAARV